MERWPEEMARKRAVRSAQRVRPKEAFSMLQPGKISPVEVRTAAPTGKEL